MPCNTNQEDTSVKIPMPIVMLFVALLASPLADAAPYTKRAPTPTYTATLDLIPREKLIVAHIKKRFGIYGAAIVNDKRFAIDPTMFQRPPHSKPVAPQHSPRPKRYDYDYVFSSWSKEQGRRFLEKNGASLDYAEKKFGVPREVIDGVLNIETQWGQRPESLGKWPVIVRLYTLAVMRPNLIETDWPERQLIAFLAIFQKSDTDPFLIKGSSTGAFGLPQFEPTSYDQLAVRCDNEKGEKEAPNLFNDTDAICSIANYLSRSKWDVSEESHRRALFAYNHDPFYVAAIMDYADWLAGKKPKHPRYQPFHPKQ